MASIEAVRFFIPEGNLTGFATGAPSSARFSACQQSSMTTSGLKETGSEHVNGDWAHAQVLRLRAT